MKRAKSLNRFSPEKNFDLSRIEHLVGVGEKISFLVNFMLFFKKSEQKSFFSIFYDSCLKAAKKGLFLDFKLMTQSMKKRIKTLSYSNLKLEDRFRIDLVFLLFQCRKWVQCFQFLAQSMKFGKKQEFNPESFGYWGYIPVLIQFFLNINSNKKFENVKKFEGTIKTRNPIIRYNFDNWVPALLYFYQILKKKKEFTSARHFFINLLKRKRLCSFFGIYQNLNKSSFSVTIQLNLKTGIICEEIKRLERNLYWNKDHDFSEEKKNIFLKKQFVRNFDLSAQKILLLKKVGKI